MYGIMRVSNEHSKQGKDVVIPSNWEITEGVPTSLLGLHPLLSVSLPPPRLFFPFLPFSLTPFPFLVKKVLRAGYDPATFRV